MNTLATLSIRVPATSANLGPGFDTMGLALSLYNTFTFHPATEDSLHATEDSPQPLPSLTGDTARQNILFTTLDDLYRRQGKPRSPSRISVHTEVPLARGLGSSATAVVAAILAANEGLGHPYASTELLALATEVEGHPDNVVPALLGGLCWSDGVVHRQIPWPGDWGVCALVPAFPVKTEAARKVLPDHYNRTTVVTALRQAGLLTYALAMADTQALKRALATEVVHQPYRAVLMPDFEPLRAALLAETLAFGLVISGSGPTLLALYPTSERAALTEWFVRRREELLPYWLTVDTTGAQIQP